MHCRCWRVNISYKRVDDIFGFWPLGNRYYEWLTPKSGGKKIPHYVKREDGNLMLFAALYDVVKLEGRYRSQYCMFSWHSTNTAYCCSSGSKETISSCTIVTTSCSKQLSFLHDRMPVIFDSSSEELDTWLDNTKSWDNATLGSLLKPYEKKLAW
jgi:putative SOS response-associated peptidase YedK